MACPCHGVNRRYCRCPTAPCNTRSAGLLSARNTPVNGLIEPSWESFSQRNDRRGCRRAGAEVGRPEESPGVTTRGPRAGRRGSGRRQKDDGGLRGPDPLRERIRPVDIVGCGGFSQGAHHALAGATVEQHLLTVSYDAIAPGNRGRRLRSLPAPASGRSEPPPREGGRSLPGSRGDRRFSPPPASIGVSATPLPSHSRCRGRVGASSTLHRPLRFGMSRATETHAFDASAGSLSTTTTPEDRQRPEGGPPSSPAGEPPRGALDSPRPLAHSCGGIRESRTRSRASDCRIRTAAARPGP